jgi:hypothetical protein
MAAVPPGSPCHYCGKPADTWDHVWPKSKGGTGERANLVPACQPCNQAKADREPTHDCPTCAAVRLKWGAVFTPEPEPAAPVRRSSGVPLMCGARTTRAFELPLTYGQTHQGVATYYCTAEPHDPLDTDHEAVAYDGPFTWWDPTEGEEPE